MFDCYLADNGDPRADIDGDGIMAAARVADTLNGCLTSDSIDDPPRAYDEPAFYDFKAALREEFPGTMIEIIPAGSFLDRITLTRGGERTVVNAAINTGP